MATQLAEQVEAEVLHEGNDNHETQTPARDAEAEARELGWKPKEEWDGRGEWRDAEEFLAVRETNLGLKKKEVDALRRKVESMERDIRRLTRAEQAAFDAGVASAKQEMREAVASGDVAAFERAEAKLEAIREDVAATPSAHGEDPDTEFAAFRENNTWYDKANLASATEIEINARLFADRLADQFAKQGLQQKLSPSEFFAKISEETEAKFPQLKSKTPRAKPASDVAGVTRVALNRGAKTFASLPPEAQRQCDRFHSQGVYGNATLEQARAKYVAKYQW